MLPSLLTVNPVPGVVPKSTPVAPMNAEPLITIVTPPTSGPALFDSEVMTGTA